MTRLSSQLCQARLAIVILSFTHLYSPDIAYSAELTTEQRVASAIRDRNAYWVETQLKLIPEGTPGRKDVVKHLKELKKQLAPDINKKEAKMAIVRKEYVYKLRKKFLDAGMDIKVSTSDTSATQLNLESALMNDVWVYKFIKESVMDIVKEKGFKRVFFNDGYDYNYSLTIK